MSLAKQIIAKHANLEKVDDNQIVMVDIDRIYLQDGNSPTIKRLFNEYGFNSVFNNELIGVFFDHSVLSPNIDISDRLKEAYDFCKQFGLQAFNQGDGISHLLAVEKKWFAPGNLVIATDSHTCTGGVVQSLALGMGASDVAAAMVTGKTWLKVPQTTWIKVVGAPSHLACAKDVILYALSVFGDKQFIYQSIEWFGDWFSTLPFDEASTIANMGVEMGAKCIFLPANAEFSLNMQPIVPTNEERLIELNIEGLLPYISAPHLPFNSDVISAYSGKKIDYVFVGSCANSRLNDLLQVASILEGNQVHQDTRLVVTPGSKNIYLEAINRGYIQTIIKSGGIVTPPGCGPCVGTQGYIPASGDNVLSTMNRNFIGRMGNPKASIWLSSPKIAAYTAIKGEIPYLEDM